MAKSRAHRIDAVFSACRPYILLMLFAFFSITFHATSALFNRAPVAPGEEVIPTSKVLKEATTRGLTAVLPGGIFLTFMCYTSVCAHVFNAFRCELYERDSTTREEWSFLVKHPNVRCSPATSVYDGIFTFGLVCMVGWCFAVPVGYFLLLHACRINRSSRSGVLVSHFALAAVENKLRDIIRRLNSKYLFSFY